MVYLVKLRELSMTWSSVWQVLWTLLTQCKPFKEACSTTKCHQVGKAWHIHQERTWRCGSTNWSKDAINCSNGHQHWRHQSLFVFLTCSTQWVSWRPLCRRHQEKRYCHWITCHCRQMWHSSSQLKKWQLQQKTELSFMVWFLKVQHGNLVPQDKMVIWLNKDQRNCIQSCQ